MTTEGPAELPAWERSGPVGRGVEMAGLAAAPLLQAWHIVRLRPGNGPSLAPDLAVVALALVCADFLSGMVHWTADWCNRPLARIHFFPALEAAVAAMTGLVPRGDEQPAPPGRTHAAADRA